MATTSVIPAQLLAAQTKFGSYTPDALAQLTAAFGNFYMSLRADVILTSAQILALLGTPITLVAAPAAGLMIIPELVIIRVFGLTAAYTDAGGAVSFACGTMSTALAANTIFTGPTNGQRSQQVITFAGTSTAAATPTNEAAALTISKATNNFAAGSGTAHISVFYSVEVANA
jgi:hypothetical protein